MNMFNFGELLCFLASYQTFLAYWDSFKTDSQIRLNIHIMREHFRKCSFLDINPEDFS